MTFTCSPAFKPLLPAGISTRQLQPAILDSMPEEWRPSIIISTDACTNQSPGGNGFRRMCRKSLIERSILVCEKSGDQISVLVKTIPVHIDKQE